MKQPIVIAGRTLVLLMIAQVLALEATANGADRPNVVFILSNNHSYYEFGCHGNEVVRTLHIDRLASQSFEFSNWHADAFCSPSRPSVQIRHRRE